MDKVYISQLHVDTIIGVYDFEKESKQSLYFDIEMLCDIAAIILAEFATNQVTIRVSKPAAVPQAQTVGVEITRRKAN